MKMESLDRKKNNGVYRTLLLKILLCKERFVGETKKRIKEHLLKQMGQLSLRALCIAYKDTRECMEKNELLRKIVLKKSTVLRTLSGMMYGEKVVQDVNVICLLYGCSIKFTMSTCCWTQVS
jgi:hypothetical protein